MISFKTWLKQYNNINKPIGDLARDIHTDNSFPKTKDKKKIEKYLNEKNAVDNALETFNSAWKQYQTDKELGYQLLDYSIDDGKMFVLFTVMKNTNKVDFYIKIDIADGEQYISISKMNQYKINSRYEHYLDLQTFPEFHVDNGDVKFITRDQYLNIIKS